MSALTPTESRPDVRGLSSCWQNNGFHVYSAGPCLDSYEQALDYRSRLDYAGVTWWPQDRRWPPAPPENEGAQQHG